MSGLMGAIGRGLSAAGYGAGEMYAKKALMEAESDMRYEREQRLLEFKAAMEDKAREAQTTRIDAKAGELADDKLAPRRGLIDATGSPQRFTNPDRQDEATAWRAEAEADMVTQKKALKGKLRTEAAIATGDISPKDAATFNQKDEAAIYKMLWEQTKEENRDRRNDEREDRKDARQEKQLAAMFARLDRSDAKGDAKTNTIQSTQVDGNGYLMGVYRDGTVKRMLDPDGKPITSQSFEQRVDRMANALVKEGDSKYRKMDPETLRRQVRQTLMSGDGVIATPSTPTPAPKPSAAASAPRPSASAAKPWEKYGTQAR